MSDTSPTYTLPERNPVRVQWEGNYLALEQGAIGVPPPTQCIALHRSEAVPVVQAMVRALYQANLLDPTDPGWNLTPQSALAADGAPTP
jgi:hypothetical protein